MKSLEADPSRMLVSTGERCTNGSISSMRLVPDCPDAFARGLGTGYGQRTDPTGAIDAKASSAVARSQAKSS